MKENIKAALDDVCRSIYSDLDELATNFDPIHNGLSWDNDSYINGLSIVKHHITKLIKLIDESKEEA